MANYVYRLGDIEKNHESYFAEGEVVASSEIRKLADRLADWQISEARPLLPDDRLPA